MVNEQEALAVTSRATRSIDSPSALLSDPFLVGRFGSPTEVDYRKIGYSYLTSLLEELASQNCHLGQMSEKHI